MALVMLMETLAYLFLSVHTLLQCSVGMLHLGVGKMTGIQILG